MSQPEYIRAHSRQSDVSLMSIPSEHGSVGITFLHAGRPSWTERDEGLTSLAERGHSHPVYHVILYTSGFNTMIHDGKAHRFARGTLVLTEPGCVHEYRPRDSGGGSFIEITFDLRCNGKVVTHSWHTILENWLGMGIKHTEWPIIIPPPHLERISARMNDVVNALIAGGRFSEASASLSMGQFIFELVQYIESGENNNEERTEDRLERAKGILERRFASSISVAELADAACLSEGAFIRSFSSRYGMPPMSYRKKLRITAARHLLSVSGRPVGEIASNVGYGDIFVFSRTFKSVTGLSPSEWRRKQCMED